MFILNTEVLSVDPEVEVCRKRRHTETREEKTENILENSNLNPGSSH